MSLELYQQTIEERVVRDDEENNRNGNETKYRFEDIISNIHLVNAAILITERGEENTVDKSVLLNPYSSMENDKGLEKRYGMGKDHALALADNKNKMFSKVIANLVYKFVENYYQYFSHVFDGLTKANLYHAIYKYKMDCVKIRMNRNIDNNRAIEKPKSHNFSVNPDRLYPLSEERYQDFANRFYSKMKRPTFRKRFIDGIQFGNNKISYYEFKHGEGRRAMRLIGVEKRVLGLSIIRHQEHTRLAISNEHGYFTCVARNKSKKQHLWELTLPLNSKDRFFNSEQQVKSRIYYGHGKKKFFAKGIDFRHLPIYIMGKREEEVG
jgi:hypothetical protein